MKRPFSVIPEFDVAVPMPRNVAPPRPEILPQQTKVGAPGAALPALSVRHPSAGMATPGLQNVMAEIARLQAMLAALQAPGVLQNVVVMPDGSMQLSIDTSPPTDSDDGSD
jgi:hypothetical protein